MSCRPRLVDLTFILGQGNDTTGEPGWHSQCRGRRATPPVNFVLSKVGNLLLSGFCFVKNKLFAFGLRLFE